MSTSQRLPVATSGGGADQNDVAVAVPANKEWELDAVLAVLTSTATAGNRQLRIQVRDGSDNVLYEVAAPATQAASLAVTYSAADGLPHAALLADDVQALPLPKLVIGAGFDVRVFDSANVDALDDLTVRVLARERGV